MSLFTKLTNLSMCSKRNALTHSSQSAEEFYTTTVIMQHVKMVQCTKFRKPEIKVWDQVMSNFHYWSKWSSTAFCPKHQVLHSHLYNPKTPSGSEQHGTEAQQQCPPAWSDWRIHTLFRELWSGLRWQFVFVRGLNMDLCLVIRCVILVFSCSLEETTLPQEKH